MPNDTYFANLSEYSREFGDEVMDRIDEYYSRLSASPHYARCKRVYNAYNGYSSNRSGADSSQVTRGGRQGELAQVKVNHLRNLVQHIHTLATAQRPVAQPIAANTDKRSHMQVTLAHGLLDYYLREKRVERILRESTEKAIIFGEGYTTTLWDSSAGKEHDVKEGTNSIEYEGDLAFASYDLTGVPRDPYATSFEASSWVAVRDFVNRHELIATYCGAVNPDSDNYEEAAKADEALRQKLLNLSSRDATQPIFTQFKMDMETDTVPVYRFFHKKTAAVPDGRMTVLCGPDIILKDGNLPYDEVPVNRIRPADLLGTTHGYTVVFDLLAIQEVIDALYSVIATNQTSFGVQNILMPKGVSHEFVKLASGLNLIKYDPQLGKPEALNLTYTPAEIFGFIKQLEEVMETLSGINSTVRGNPEASLKSGSALALVQSQAIQFSSGLQQSFANHVEDVFTQAFTTLKQFAKTKRVALIVGKYNQHMLKSFVGDDLSDIKRVVVDSGSALSKTTSGRMQIAQDLLQNQLIKTPEEYLSVINTGRLEPLTESQNRELINIRAENEMLAEGKPVRALAIDDHRLHILEHKTVLDNPDAREATPENKPIQDATLSHIEEHIQFLKTVDPALLAVLGQQSLATAMMPPEQAAGGTPPKGGPSGPNIPQPPPQGIPSDAKMPELDPPPIAPQVPKNPATGQPWNPTDGGDVMAGAVAANNVK